MSNKMRAIIVKPNQIPVTEEFDSITQVLRTVGIKAKTPWETYKVGIDGVGMCIRDQDVSTGRANLFGMKGAFAVIGMDRRENDHGDIDMTIFKGLTDEQHKEVMKGLVREAVLGGHMAL